MRSRRCGAASAVPIFGVSSSYIGHGAVGGVVLDLTQHGVDLGGSAVRMLAGDTPLPVTTGSQLMADWRELQRFRISASQLPDGTAVLFREPTLWEEQKYSIILAALIVLVETALVVALVRSNTRRRHSERDILARLRFEEQLSEFAAGLGAVDPAGTMPGLEPGLARLAAALSIDWVWRWGAGDPLDVQWQSPLLGSGEPCVYPDAAALPPSLQRRLQAIGAQQCSALAVPIEIEGIPTGAMFWLSRRPGLSWAARIDQLRIAGAVLSTALQRKQAQLALAGSNELKSAILDSMPAHVAVVDRGGRIIAVNDAWTAFARAAGTDVAVGPAISYFEGFIGMGAGREFAEQASELVERACASERTDHHIEYRCDIAGEARWFEMTAEPLRGPKAAPSSRIGRSRRASGRSSRCARANSASGAWRTACPSWSGCRPPTVPARTLNSQWLDMTGLTMAQESGDGWLDSVHAADRAACQYQYRRAFHSRQPFRAEYRLRRQDGEYRWMADTGVPRYGADGEFHGHIGGCIDVTETKAAEHMLRELSRRLMGAQDDERRRIARELHDHLSQQLALLAIDLQHLSVEPPSTVEAFVPALQEAWRRTTEIASDVHSISHRLHPSKMESLGLVATARGHCREVSRQSVAV